MDAARGIKRKYNEMLAKETYKRALMDYFKHQIGEIHRHIARYNHHLAHRHPVEIREIQDLRQELDAFAANKANENIPMLIVGPYPYDVVKVIVESLVAQCWNKSDEIVDLMIDGFRSVDMRPPSPEMRPASPDMFASDSEISASE